VAQADRVGFSPWCAGNFEDRGRIDDAAEKARQQGNLTERDVSADRSAVAPSLCR
jgi:hypothetical protein